MKNLKEFIQEAQKGSSTYDRATKKNIREFTSMISDKIGDYTSEEGYNSEWIYFDGHAAYIHKKIDLYTYKNGKKGALISNFRNTKDVEYYLETN